MGIKYFFSWFRQRFSRSIFHLNKNEKFSNNSARETPVYVDNLLIDLNGIFHESAQKIYKYGQFKEPRRLLGLTKNSPNNLQKQIDTFKDICETINNIVSMVEPRKKVILCIDGPAPLSKQNQQRQRRFLSSTENINNNNFDSNCITPGTKFMDHLSKYIDWHIKKSMTENSLWKNIEVIFSNEKCPGEGEHKLISFIRKYCQMTESFCIHGMDADLIMLSLGTHIENFYILRDEPMVESFDFYLIDVKTVRADLDKILRWDDSKCEKKYKSTNAINDFIFMCFTVGNDFLPHIPAIEIVEGGIDFMIDVYKNTCSTYGHLIKKTAEGIIFRKKSLKAFLGTVSQYEKGVLETKLKHREKFFPDPLLEKNTTYSNEEYNVCIENYRKEYYIENIPDVDLKEICHHYLDGMLWVMTYYTQGVPDWKWRYPYHYAPFSYDIAEHIDSYLYKKYKQTKPTIPFIQLLSVLPPASAKLLPTPLDQILTSPESPMLKYCPEDFPIDLTGKRQEWEGIVILPMVDYDEVEQWYLEKCSQVDIKEIKRNILGKSFIYSQGDKTYLFRSFYGDFNCKIKSIPIEI
jgi:5'-3' exonuclease